MDLDKWKGNVDGLKLLVQPELRDRPDTDFDVGQTDSAWKPNLDSPALAVTGRVYERLFGTAPTITALHAWLETATIGDRVPGLDMVSFGPSIEAPHSPDERVSIPTVERFWRLLAGVVDELSETP